MSSGPPVDEVASARRLYSSGFSEALSVVELDDEARQHRKVLRLRDGDDIELFDGHGHVAQAILQGASARVLSVRTVTEPVPRLGLVIGTPKAKVADDVVRFATELGAAELVFVSTERSVPRIKGKKDNRLVRWNRIAREACRQSERAFLPQLRIMDALTDAIACVPDAANRYVCHARGTGAARPTGAVRWVIVGPEGGLSDSELLVLRASGFEPLSLGRHILRVDTAACAAMTLLAG